MAISKKSCSTAGKLLAKKNTPYAYKQGAATTLAKCKTKAKKTTAKKKK